MIASFGATRRLLVPVTIVSFSLAGCASTGPDQSSTTTGTAAGTAGQSSSGGFFSFLSGEDESQLTPAERQLREDAELFNETVFGGIVVNAVTGAVVGALAGFILSGGNLNRTLAGAGIGGGAGAIYGAVDGYRTAKRQEAARKQVREIELMVEEVEAENTRLAQSIQTTDVVIAETRADLRNAQDQLKRQEISAAEYEAERQRAQRNVAAMDELIEGVQTRRDEYRSVADAMRQEGEDTRELDAQIQESSTKLAELKAERDLLAEELEVGRIG